MGAAQWPADGHLPEHGIVFAAGHLLWRQRHHHFRAAHGKTHLHGDRPPLYPMHRAGRRIPTAELITPDIVITAPAASHAAGWHPSPASGGDAMSVWLHLQRICSR